MKMKLTQKLVDSVEPETKPYQIHDTECRGLFLRVQPSGVSSFYFRFRGANGQDARVLLGKTDALRLGAARKRANQKRGEVASGKDPREEKRARLRAQREAAQKGLTLRRYIEDTYAEWATINLKSSEKTLSRLRSAFRDFLDEPIRAITLQGIEKWKKARLGSGASKATINRDLATMRAALSRGVKNGDLSDNPLQKVTLFREVREGRVRYLTEAEENRLFAALDKREERIRRGRDRGNAWRSERGRNRMPNLREVEFADHLKPMVILALHCGLRRGEIFDLHWRDVSFDRAMLTVRAKMAKSGKRRDVPLNQAALDALQAWREQTGGSGRVFPSRRINRETREEIEGRFDNINSSWRSIVKEAKIEDFRFHDLRHTFASKLVMAGVDLYVTKKLLGHSTIQMTERYSHLAPDHLADAVAKISALPVTKGGRKILSFPVKSEETGSS